MNLFGGVSIQSETGPLSGRAVQRHRLALLAMLASARERGVTRDRLVRLLWPDTELERARRQLSDSVYRINTALGGDVITAAGDELKLRTDRLPCDVIRFCEACERAEWQKAVELYAGPFLDGFSIPDSAEFESWVDDERERLRRSYASALETLATQSEAVGNTVKAVEYWRTLAAHDRFNSRIALRLIQALAAAGERAAALQHARTHTLLLREELDVEPSVEMIHLVADLKRAGATRIPYAQSIVGVGVAIVKDSVEHTHSPAAPTSRPEPARRIRWLSTALIVALAGSTLVALAMHQRRTAPVNPSVAVLPFADHSPRGEHEYFSDGLTEELISLLSRVDRLQVAARTSSFALKKADLDARGVGRRLGVTSVLEGSVRYDGRLLRITAQLVDTKNGYELWSDTYDRPAADVLAVQEEIARAIVSSLKGALLPSEAAALASTPIAAESYDLYLKGRYYWHRRGQQDLALAVSSFEEVVKREPSFARGWVGLADAYAISGFYDYLPPRTAFPRARSAAMHALELDVQLAPAYNTLGYITLYFDWDFARAEQYFRRALQLDSTYSTAHQWYGNLLTAAGRFPEADREMRRAEVLDPLSLIASAAHGWSFYFARRYADANAQLLRTLALDSTFQLAHLWRGWTLEELGQLDSMQASLERGVQLSGGSAIHVAALARSLARRGSRNDALRLLAALERGEHGYAPAYELAKVQLGLGNNERAIDLLERALEERAHSIAFVHVDPQLDAIRQNSRFQKLLKRVDQP